MKAAKRSFVSKHGNFKKAMAVATALALVASMGNLQAWAPQAFAATSCQVQVTFELEQGITVTKVGTAIQNLTAESAEHIVKTSVNDGAPLTFEAEAQPVGNVSYKIDVDKSSVNLKASAETAAVASFDDETALSATDQDVQAEPYSEFSLGTDEAEELTASPEALISQTEEDVDAHSDAIVEEDVTEEEAATPLSMEAEQIEDDETPQASGENIALADEGDDAIITKVTLNDDGSYQISPEVVRQAANESKIIVVKLVKCKIAEGDIAEASTWDEVVAGLQSEGVTEVRLTDNIAVDASASPATIQTKKNLNLNGFSISCDASSGSLNGKSLIVVEQNGALTVIDEATEGIKPIQSANKEALPYPTNDEGKDNSAALLEAIGKTATYDAEEKKLTYYVTESKWDEPAQGRTTEYVSEFTLSMAKAGALEGEGLNALIEASGGKVNIMGGRFTNNGKHTIEITLNKYNTPGSVTMTGGFIVGSKGSENGAGIFADNTKGCVTLSGNAVIAGNEAVESGGGIYVIGGGTVEVSGDTLIAGNKAGTEENSVDLEGGSKERYKQAAGTYSWYYNGGGIYVGEGTSVNLSENAIVAGNWAARDGGGIYVLGPEQGARSGYLYMGGNVIITNNRAMNNREAYHVDGNTKEGNKYHYGGGGGGIFSTADFDVEGGQITANYADDSGGGIYAPNIDGSHKPTLTMEKITISSNACRTSEGGGMSTLPKEGSQILTGYVTNNVTLTEFDYGGGGIFVTSGGTLQVYDPLVTGNTAHGFGGGVAACTNGTILTADAAIFNNIAKQLGHTTNGVEYGDQWGQAILKNETTAENDPDYATKVKQHSSSDYFSAKASTVYNNMLGGGLHNWSGYMSRPVYESTITLEKYTKPLSTSTASNDSRGFLMTGSGSNAEKPFGYVWRIEQNTVSEASGVTEFTLYIKKGAANNAVTISQTEAETILQKLSGANATWYNGEKGVTKDWQHGFFYIPETSKKVQEETKDGAACYKFTVQFRPEKYTIERYADTVVSSYAGFLKSVDGRGFTPYSYLKDISMEESSGVETVTLEVPKGDSPKGLTKGEVDSFVQSLDRAPLAIYDGVTNNDTDCSSVHRGIAIVSSDAVEEGDSGFTISFTLAKSDGDASFGPITNSVMNVLDAASSVHTVYAVSAGQLTFAGYSTAERFMALKSNPTQEDIDNAYAEANMYVTGNWSSTNGGGIACNGLAVIGHDPNKPNNPPAPLDKPVTGELTVTKKIEGDTANLEGSLTAVFSVKGYEKKTGINDGKDKVYDNVIGFSFSEGQEMKAETLTNLPEGYYIVEELDIDGDNFAANETEVNGKAGRTYTFSVQKSKTDDEQAPSVVKYEVTFTNTVNHEGFGSGVVNTYAKGEDGTFSYTQDENYRSRAQTRSDQAGE